MYTINDHTMTTPRQKKNLFRLAIWTLAWTLSMLLAKYGPGKFWDNNTAITIVFVLLNFGLGIGMILVNRKFIIECDELEQKIQLESLAITLGLSVIVGLSYALLDQLELINQKAEIAQLVIFIGVTYLIAMLVNTLRYR